MKLYLVRHGEAIDDPIDSQRTLSVHGRAQVLKLAHYLLAHGNLDPDLMIFHSGLLRAKQTAELLAKQMAIVTVQPLFGLLPHDSVGPTLSKIADWEHDTLLVTHLPYVQELLWALAPTRDMIMFSPASAVCLEQIAQGWQLLWQFTP